jgi:hypothetical protein
VPRKIVTDQLRSYPAAKAEIPELDNVKHVVQLVACFWTLGLRGCRLAPRIRDSWIDSCGKERLSGCRNENIVWDAN